MKTIPRLREYLQSILLFSDELGYTPREGVANISEISRT
jgi:hypothetical protein